LPSFFRASLLFSLGILLSRIFGYIRDATIAYYFGASAVSDAFFIAFRIPNAFRRIFGEGGFNAVFIPFYGEAVKRNTGEEFLRKTFGLLITFSLLVVLIGIFFSKEIISVISPGIKGKYTFNYAVEFLKFTILYLPLVSFYAYSMAILLVRGKFFIPSVSQTLFNLGFILSLVILFNTFGHYSLVLAVLIGGLFQIIPNVLLLLREKLLKLPKFSLDEEIRNFLKKFLFTLGGFSANQLSLFVDTFLASFLEVGSISYVYYAARIYLLPISLFSISLSNTLLAFLSTKKGKGKDTEVAFKLTLMLSIPSSIGLFLLSKEIVSVLYKRGNFSEEDLIYTSGLLSIYAFSIPFYSLQHILKSIYYSRKNVELPTKSAFLSVFLEAFWGSFFIFLLGFGVYSFPFAALISSIVTFIFLYLNLPEKLAIPYKSLVKYIVASIAMGLLIYLVKSFIENPFALLTLIPFFGIYYFLILTLLGEETIPFKRLKSFKF